MNFANSFLKDIKGNSSINQFGSKIKNMSQSFVPENTKDMLASAASSISNATATAATAATSNTTTTASSNMTNSSSQSNQLRPGKSSQKIANSDSQMDARYSTSGVYSQSPSTSFQQPQQQQQRIINPSQRVTRTESNNNDQYNNNNNNNNNNNTRSTSLQREPSNQFVPKQQQMYSSLETMSESSPYTNTYTNNNNNKINQIDPMELEALKETNEALKTEVQRLSLFELKSKSLEKEAKNAKDLRETNEKLELDLKELTKYKLQCQKLDTEINQLKSIKRADEDQLKQLEKMSHSNKEKLEIENENLKNKIFNLDKLINEYEQNFAQFKQKEQSLENRIEYLEKELDRLTNNNTNTNTNSNIDQINSNNSPDHNIKQLDALEQANRILEQELESLKKQQKLERDKVKEKMDILQAKQSEKLKKLEDSNIYYKEQFEKSKKGDNETVEYLRKQCDDLRQRVNELEHVEQHHQETAAAMNTSQHVNLERNFLELKKEMQTQSDLLSEERRKFEMERKNFNDLNLEYKKLNETIQNENRKHAQEIESYEQRLNHLQTVLDRKEAEINELKKSKELDASNYLTKLSALNDENLSLVNQLKSISNNTNFKDEELNKQRKKLQDLVNEYDKLRGQLKSCSNLEQDLNEANIKHKHANEKITNLEQKITEWERKYNKELEDFNNFSQQQQQQIKQLKQQLTSETLKHESLNADFSLLKLEASKLESLKSKCDHLESELKETRANKLTRLNDYEQTAHKFHETNEKYENEIKMLNSQINNLRNDMKIKEQESKQLEKSIESERTKAISLIKQLEELNAINSQLTMQNAEFKRRLVSLDLLTDECNQLRKNLTLMTIESESRKAEVSTLNSQISILENTVKSLRDASEKHSKLEMNYDSASYELKKKHDDFKRLQQLHETVKKEQLDTIELLEEKLRDVEKKTELQSLKHEEIMLELESIRAKRERLMPFCPQCSTQQIAMYQPLQTSTNAQNSPQQYINTGQTTNMLPSQPLLSISIPQPTQSLIHTPQSNISPGSHHYQQIPAQAHLSHYQVITLPGKQSVTVECQTSPTSNTTNKSIVSTNITTPNVVNKRCINVSCQTNEPIRKQIDYKEVNTDPIDFSLLNAKKQPILPKPIMRNQSISVDILPIRPITDEIGIQTTLIDLGTTTTTTTTTTPATSNKQQEKYYLYMCKYSYDPFKNSPNDNPEAELPLRTGDYLYILNEDDEYGFYNGELLNGRRGLVPSNFVERFQFDSNNMSKSLQSLSKDILAHAKLKDCANLAADFGQIMIAAQQTIQKLDVKPPVKYDETTQTNLMNTITVATSTIAISTVSVGVMTTNTTQPPPPLSSTTTTTIQQPISSTTITANAPKLTATTTTYDDGSDTSIKIGLPYPNNLKVEKFSEKSVIVTWDAPNAPISLSQSIDGEMMTSGVTYNEFSEINNIQNYNVYLNHELYTMVNVAEDRVVIIDDVDFSVPNRVSVQAIVNKEISSKPQECTLIFGSNRSFAPSNLSVFSLSQTSAIVSWWPSSSLFSHIISIDSIEHRTLKPGVYRFKLSGLLPDTSHLVIVTAQIPNHTNESSSNYAASVEFRTLQAKTLGIPQNLAITKDPNEIDAYNLTWEPPVTINNPVSNGIHVGGYSIYLDGIRVHQILNPIASTVSLSAKLLFNNGAKLLTVRTLSLDGNSESKDSQPIKLSKSMMQMMMATSAGNKVAVNESIPKKQPEQQQSSNIFGAAGNLFQNVSNEMNALKTNTKNVLNEIKPQNTNTNQTTTAAAVAAAAVAGAQPMMTKKISNPMIKNMPLVSDIKKKQQTQQKPIDTDADLYENFSRNEPKPVAKPQKANIQNPYNTPNIIGTPQKKVINNEPAKPIQQQQQPVQQQQQQPVQQQQQQNKTNKNYRLFIALFDYDPYQMSPNQDSCSEELPFKEGQLIKVLGDQDDDGYYYGESNGRSGYIPGNMVSEVPMEDQLNQQSNEQMSPSKKTTTKQQQQQQQSFQTVSNNNKQQQQQQPQPQQQLPPKITMIALYDYDPQSLSPNVDLDVELPFRVGDIITVIGEMDEDGFFMAELKGKRGLVPSNFLQPIQQQQQYR